MASTSYITMTRTDSFAVAASLWKNREYIQYWHKATGTSISYATFVWSIRMCSVSAAVLLIWLHRTSTWCIIRHLYLYSDLHCIIFQNCTVFCSFGTSHVSRFNKLHTFGDCLYTVTLVEWQAKEAHRWRDGAWEGDEVGVVGGRPGAATQHEASSYTRREGNTSQLDSDATNGEAGGEQHVLSLSTCRTVSH